MDATTGKWSHVTHRATVVGLAVGSLMLTGACAAQPAAAPSTSTIPVTVVSTLRVTTSVTATVTPPTVTTSVTVPVTQTAPAVTVTAAAPGPAAAFHDGTYLVGKQVEPGTYQASNPNPGGGLCYWERTTSTGEIIDNGVNSGVMYVDPTDFAIRVDGCGSWAQVG